MKPSSAILVLLVPFCVFSLTETQTNYCKANLCKGKKHIACNNNGNFKRPCTASARLVPVTGLLRRALVNRHNQYRNVVAQGKMKRFKPAIRMAPMRWDKELARLAALNVKQCVMQHDKCRSTKKFKLAGQNLAAWSGTGTNPSVKSVALGQIKSWFLEHRVTKMAHINRLPGNKLSGIGHFTAMMQEKSTHIGCAILRQKKGRKIQQFLACNYAYTNILQKPVYRKGRTGSKCKTGRHKRYKGLCSSKEKYNVNSGNY